MQAVPFTTAARIGGSVRVWPLAALRVAGLLASEVPKKKKRAG
jgi:hypothetical protein